MNSCKEPRCNCHVVEAQRKADLSILKNVDWDRLPDYILREFVRILNKGAV